jgi:hypothetical protein
MTDKLGDLDAKRKEKEKQQPKCQACGNNVHDYAGQCPRIQAITHETDGGITYHLWAQDEPDEPLAG